jgi:phage tail sheath protein FI
MAPSSLEPGVYVDEVPIRALAIDAASTSTALFVGWSPRGPVDAPVRIASQSEYEAGFGGLDVESDLGHSIAHFFANGGRDAWVVRLAADDACVAAGESADLRVTAASHGAWGNRLHANLVKRRGRSWRFRLDVRRGSARSAVVERFDDLSLATDDARYAPTVINAASALIRVEALSGAVTRSHAIALAGGNDGAVLVPGSDAFRSALMTCFESGGCVDAVGSFNLLCVPGEASAATQAWLQAQCVARRAFYIADCDARATLADLLEGPDPSLRGADGESAALYAPWVLAPDPPRNGSIRAFPPCGFVAGIYARTDATRGVWKAPAGPDATLIGSTGLTAAIDTGDADTISTLGIDCLRTLADLGDVVWGARTLADDYASASEFKYVPVRRLQLHVEASIERGLQWTVFEPNAEPLWAQVRLTIGDFLQNLWRSGALMGTAAREAWFVKCDATTMTRADIDNGRLVVEIGIAPLQPAEFVIIRIGAWAQCEQCRA